MNRFAKSVFVSALLALSTSVFAVNAPAAANQVTPALSPEVTKVQEIVHSYLVQHPEVLVEAMQALQQKQMDQTQQTIKETQKIANNFADRLFRQKNDPTAGNPSGTVTVVEFFDYQCPHCIDMAPTLSTIAKNNANVRIIYKEFPIRGPISDFAARAALAANLQGKYLALHDALLTNKTQPLTEDTILKMAAQTGINVDQLKKDMNAPAIADQLKINTKLAEDLKLFGTPALFIGKSGIENNKGNIAYVPGQMDQTQLQQSIDQQK